MSNEVQTDTSYKPPNTERPVPTVVEKLGQSVKKHCNCGGRGPEDVKACPACLVWAEMQNVFRALI